MKKLQDALALMELSPGANVTKREVGMENVETLMTKAHAIRCPGDSDSGPGVINNDVISRNVVQPSFNFFLL